MENIIVTTGEAIPGKRIKEILGPVKGNTVRARHIGRDVMAGFKNVVGGEIKSYTDMIAYAREEAYNRMINDAITKKADAVINFRFSTSMVMQGAAEMLAYGTAVKLS